MLYLAKLRARCFHAELAAYIRASFLNYEPDSRNLSIEKRGYLFVC